MFYTGNFCECSACACLFFKNPTNATGVSIADYDTVTSWDKRTKQEMLAIQKDKEKVNYGAYLRTLMLNRSKKDDKYFSLKIPMSLLHPLFSIDAPFPMKRILTINLKLNKPSMNLLCPSADKNYKLAVKDIYCDFAHLVFEQSLRSGWMEAINENNLVRCIDFPSVRHFPVATGTQFAFFPSILTYTTLPQSLIIFFITNDQHEGDYTKNSFSYKSRGLKSISLTINGEPHFLNVFTNDMNIKTDSADLFRWYEQFIAVFGEKAGLNVPIQVFEKDFFLYCYDLTSTPRNLRVDEVTGEANNTLITSASLDLSCQFKTATTEAMVIYCIGLQKAVCEFTVDGEAAESVSD